MPEQFLEVIIVSIEASKGFYGERFSCRQIVSDEIKVLVVLG